jgi:hypothetical protein
MFVSLEEYFSSNYIILINLEVIMFETFSAFLLFLANCAIETYHLPTADSTLLPFVFIISKPDPQNVPNKTASLLWFEPTNLHLGISLQNADDLRSRVKACQWQFDTARQLRIVHEKAYMPVELFDTQNPSAPK